MLLRQLPTRLVNTTQLPSASLQTEDPKILFFRLAAEGDVPPCSCQQLILSPTERRLPVQEHVAVAFRRPKRQLLGVACGQFRVTFLGDAYSILGTLFVLVLNSGLQMYLSEGRKRWVLFDPDDLGWLQPSWHEGSCEDRLLPCFPSHALWLCSICIISP